MAAFVSKAAHLELTEVPAVKMTAEAGYRVFHGEAKLNIGNFDVKLTFGGDAATTNFVKFAGRRLLCDRLVTAPGERKTFEATVRLPGPYSTRKATADSNKSLVIDVFTTAASAPSVEFEPSADSLTFYLCGDSTTTDQRGEPWGSWGQIAPAFFKKGVAVSNFAKSGLAMATFEGDGRLVRILENIKAGDWVLIQFGHNDQKRKGEEPENGYTRRLGEWTDKLQAKGANVIIATPIERRRFSNGVQSPHTLAGYADAARAFAKARGLPLIDMNELSYAMMGAAGEEGSKAFQCWYEKGSYPGVVNTINDNTHHSIYGAYEMARIEASEITRLVPGLKDFVRERYRMFDPLKFDPDPMIPPSAVTDSKKPDGN